MSWKIIIDDYGFKHVYPLDEEDRHKLTYVRAFFCDCHARILIDDEIVVHASFDGREGLEEAMEILNLKK